MQSIKNIRCTQEALLIGRHQSSLNKQVFLLLICIINQLINLFLLCLIIICFLVIVYIYCNSFLSNNNDLKCSLLWARSIDSIPSSSWRQHPRFTPGLPIHSDFLYSRIGINRIKILFKLVGHNSCQVRRKTQLSYIFRPSHYF